MRGIFTPIVPTVESIFFGIVTIDLAFAKSEMAPPLPLAAAPVGGDPDAGGDPSPGSSPAGAFPLALPRALPASSDIMTMILLLLPLKSRQESCKSNTIISQEIKQTLRTLTLP